MGREVQCELEARTRLIYFIYLFSYLVIFFLLGGARRLWPRLRMYAAYRLWPIKAQWQFGRHRCSEVNDLKGAIQPQRQLNPPRDL
jgi:type III secretory pathway component EscT